MYKNGVPKEKKRIWAMKDRLLHRGRIQKYHQEWYKTHTKQLRTLVLFHYGGNPPKCFCCGENNTEFLCIDHINGNGNKHRREIKSSGGSHFYRWLVRNNYPPGFRVLCHNCNMSISCYGYCPHQKERTNA